MRIFIAVILLLWWWLLVPLFHFPSCFSVCFMASSSHTLLRDPLHPERLFASCWHCLLTHAERMRRLQHVVGTGFQRSRFLHGWDILAAGFLDFKISTVFLNIVSSRKKDSVCPNHCSHLET